MAEYIERNEAWFSNCFIEAMKAKLKYGKRVKIIHIPARKNEVFCPHYMWHNLSTTDYPNARVVNPLWA